MDTGRERVQAGSAPALSAPANNGRLMIMLDWGGLDLPGHLLAEVCRRICEIVGKRFGDVCRSSRIRRAYYGAGDADARRWHERYSSERKIAGWRTPRRKGRKPPIDWDYWIRRHALDWGIRDPEATDRKSAVVLVSNEGDFTTMIGELDRAGVRQLLICADQPSPALRRAYGTRRIERITLDGKI